MSSFPLKRISLLKKELSRHPIYSAIHNKEDLTLFMQHHIYSVWDFMSLVKYLQNQIAPANTPWHDNTYTDVKRFINEIVLEEESDIGVPLEDGTPTYTSHFNLYTMAMEEVRSGSSKQAKLFVDKVVSHSLDEAFETVAIPTPAKEFVRTTFNFINCDKPHVVAAVFALGREHIIPTMFSELLDKMQIDKNEAKTFHCYLDRHIELDGTHHGPMSLKMLELLCDGDAVKIQETENAAINAILYRIKFWDGVLLALQH